MGYYLTDGIYPKWATLVSATKHPRNHAERHFTARQESVRKDVERAFGVLQARWHIIARAARKHSMEDLGCIMMTCIILHNMIVENERDDIGVENWRLPSSERLEPLQQTLEGDQLVARSMAAREAIENVYTNMYLVHDLTQHLYTFDANRGIETNHEIRDDAPTTPEGGASDDDDVEDDDDEPDGFE